MVRGISIQNSSGKYKSDLGVKLLCASLFFSGLRCYGLFTIGTFTGSLFKIFSLLMIIISVAKLMTRSYKLYLDKTTSVLFIILFIDIITALHSKSYSLFASYFVSHVILLFAYIVVMNGIVDTASLVKSYAYGAIIPGLIGMYQWISVMTGHGVPRMPFSQFVVSVGKDDIFLYGNYRVVGTLQDPSYFGLYMASVLVICLGLLISSECVNWKKAEKCYVYFLAVLCVACIFASGSVTSMIAAVAGAGFLLFRNGANISKTMKYLFIAILALSLAMIVMIYIFDYNPIDVLLTKLRIQGTKSTIGAFYGREDFFRDAINDFWKNPIFGVGFGNTTRSSGHNSFLTILAIQGLIGFALHVRLNAVIPFFNSNCKLYKPKDKALYNTCAAAMFGMLLQIMGYDCLYKMDPSIVIILLVMASIRRGRSNMLTEGIL